MLPTHVSLSEIVDINDPLFLSWLDLYETAFPFNERMLVSSVIKNIQRISRGEDGSTHYIALVDEHRYCLGLMVYYTHSLSQTAWLWYMAVKSSLRSRGLGSYLYQQLLQCLDPAYYKMLILEVEIPGSENSLDAQRRIAFYKRQGALLLDGINYVQKIGWHSPPTRLHLMVHQLHPLNVDEVFRLAKDLFEDALQQVGELALR